MIVGHTHTMQICRVDADTLWLQIAGTDSESIDDAVAMQRSEAPHAKQGDSLRVFVFADNAGRPVATTTIPVVTLGQCAALKVTSITNAGAYLDWGIAKELLLPYAEQRRPLEVGAFESVLVYLDNSGRLAASSRLDHHLPDTWAGFRPWQKVTLLVYQRTDLGFKAVIDNCARGLLYKDEIFQPVRVGDTLQGYIKRPRADGRIDLCLQPPVRDSRGQLSEQVLDYIRQHGGTISLTDKSPPEDIYNAFKVSKKNYKRALSTLYKQRLIIIEPDRIILNPETP